MDLDEAFANNEAVENGALIHSTYELGDDTIWILTSGDRKTTTMLVPDDY